MFVPKHFGKVIKGKLELYNKDSFLEEIKKLDGKRISLAIIDETVEFSVNLNNYIYGVLFTLPSEQLVWGYTKDETKDLLKERYAPRVEIDNRLKVKSLGKPVEGQEERFMTNKEKIKFIEESRQFLAEQGVYIPDPNELYEA